MHAILPVAAKRIAWNLKYSLLKYPVLDAPADSLEYLRARLCDDAYVLELGCGRGSLLRGLRKDGWNGHYCGLDISSRAITDARKCGDQRAAWVVSDIESFRSGFKWDAIVLIESIYYVRLHRAQAVLERLIQMIKPSGFLLIRFHDCEKHREYVAEIYKLFPAAEAVSAQTISVHRSRCGGVS